MLVTRLWKSNGDRNQMPLDAALDNLASNAIDYDRDVTVKERRTNIRARLMAGNKIETPLAFFRLSCFAL